MQVNASRGQFRSTSSSRLTQVFQRYGVEEMEQLLPKENPKRTMRMARAYNGETIVERDLSQLYCVKLSEEHAFEAMQLIDELKQMDEVEFAEPNYRLYTLEDVTIDGITGSNPLATSQWYLQDYGVTTLWTKPIINHTRPVIAIIDTGVDMTHPDLAPNLWTNPGEVDGENGYDNDGNGFANDLHGWDFINNTPNVRDFNMHGTHVAGIAAAANNNIGIIGANPRALIMPVSVLQSDGSGDAATIIKGVNYAVQNGATVLNLSLGSYANSKALRQALQNAYGSAIIIAAAGNDNRCINTPHKHLIPPAPMFPAAYSFVLGVQATTQGGGLAIFSNYDDDGNHFSIVTTFNEPDGFNYELKAPGTDIYSTIPGGKYKTLNGTSMASPLVAGAISFLTMVKDYTKDDNTIHQEILWGDLLHTDNIAQAYDVTNRPAELDLINIMYRERKDLADQTEEDYSNDGEIDAGETVSLYPVIRTTFGAASNIQMKLEMGDEFEDPNTVEILTPDWVNFGLPLSAYGRGVSLNPIQLRVSDNVADNRHIKMKFTAKCDETNTLYEGKFTIKVTNMVKIGGLISEDCILTADHVYLVNQNIGIMEGATLTIEPGSRIEFAEGMGLSSYGKLIANGIPGKPIVFTGHNGALWTGVKSHESTGIIQGDDYLYTNDDQSLWTLLPTESTPKRVYSVDSRAFYTKPNEVIRHFYLRDYMPIVEDMTVHQDLLTDPNYLTPAITQLLEDWETYCDQYPNEPTEGVNRWNNSKRVLGYPWFIYNNPRDTLSYCLIDGYFAFYDVHHPYMKDCIISNAIDPYYLFYSLEGEKNTIMGASGNYINIPPSQSLYNTNIINNIFDQEWFTYPYFLPSYSSLANNNYFNNYDINGKYSLAFNTDQPSIDKSDKPSYLGTSREDIVRQYIYEIGNAPNTFGKTDLSNMRTEPVPEAHGIVWKVCVNDYDAQDEYDQLPPLGVGKHKFEVYFNRPMNKAIAPHISFGVRDPWTQNAVNEEGNWNEEGTIYTAYKTITGKTKSDGVNRIYVYGAEDNEFFEIPYEKTRFNVMINAAGSMATGFAAEAGLGRVNLTWDNSHNDFEDAMGFNIYRYELDDEGNEVNKTCLNQEIVDIETEDFTDYDVVPGTTYYYMYKVLSTDLQEYDVSNVVAATPLTATLGDADGSGEVDVTDVVATVNYVVGIDQKPFIFEAADINKDLLIDVLDVIGIVQKVLNQSASRATIESIPEAVYTIEDGVLYVESPFALAGVQVQVSLSEECKTENVEFAAATDMKGFELASAWLTDSDYLLLAYSFGSKKLGPGKHAILKLGDGELTSLRLCDTDGHRVNVVAGEATVIKDAMGSKVMNTKGVYNLNGQKITGNTDVKLRKGVYIINGQKVVK